MYLFKGLSWVTFSCVLGRVSTSEVVIKWGSFCIFVS